MSLHSSRARVAGLSKDLISRWNETRNYWQDAKAQQFEDQYLKELTSNVNSAVAAMEKLDLLLNRIRSDCE